MFCWLLVLACISNSSTGNHAGRRQNCMNSLQSEHTLALNAPIAACIHLPLLLAILPEITMEATGILLMEISLMAMAATGRTIHPQMQPLCCFSRYSLTSHSRPIILPLCSLTLHIDSPLTGQPVSHLLCNYCEKAAHLDTCMWHLTHIAISRKLAIKIS